MTKITKVYFKRFFIRLAMLFGSIIAPFTSQGIMGLIYMSIWFILMKEMLDRIFPTEDESMGNQKIFLKNYISKLEIQPKRDYITPLKVAIIWFAPNTVFWILFYKGILNQSHMLILSMLYGVGDMICVLWYCPFQRWIMRNRCCNVCRIYNWDFIMMFTPLICILSPFTYSLIFLGLIIFIIWEITYFKHPERFSDKTNLALSCENCTEKACKNKWRFINSSELHPPRFLTKS